MLSQDQIIRRALWEVYNTKCFYTGIPLEYTDMELDHIIPASYKDKPDELSRLLKQCGLNADFDLNSIHNLVPTNKFNNNRKSDMEFEIGPMMYYLGIVKKKVPAIEKKIESLKKKRNYYEHLSMLKAHMDAQEDEKNRENVLANIVNFISDEMDGFIEQEELYDRDNKQMFKKYKKRIGLEAILPKYNNPETECIVYFNTLKARDCMLILDNKHILSQLFDGLFTDPIYGTRGFIEFERSKLKNQDFVDLNNVKICLGNNRIKLSVEDIYVLCEVVDAYAIKYLECISTIENKLRSYSFPLSRRRNNYKLVALSYVEWRKIVEYSIKYDVALGNSEWHIFDRNYHYIRVYTDKNHTKYEPGYHAFYHAEFSEEIVLSPELGSKDVCVTFEFIEDLDRKGLKRINEKENWSVEAAYNWFVNELMPKVLGRSVTKRILNKDKDNFFRYKVFEKVHYCESTKDLYEVISLIQSYFHFNPHKRYRIRKQDFIGIYKSIIISIKRSKKVDLFYICNKLNIAICHSKEELIISVKDLLESIEDTTIDGFGLDYLFRAFLIIIENKKVNFLIEDIEQIHKEIRFFSDLHDREAMLEKYALDFE